MKKLLTSVIFYLILCSNTFAENVYDFLEYNIKENYGTLYLNSHNKHGSKTINLTKIQIWFSSCSNRSADPDRIYNISRKNKPYSDLSMVLSNSFDHDGSMCHVITAKFIEPVNKELTKEQQKKYKKLWDSSNKKTKKNKSDFNWPGTVVVIIFMWVIFAMASKATKVKKNKKTGHFEVVDEEVSEEPVPLKKTATKKNTNEFEILAKFYNDYKSIDFTDSKSIISKANKKQTEMLVNIIMPNIQSLANNYPANTQVVMILIKLVEDNLVTEEKFIEVHKNLKEMKNIGEKVGLNQKLMTALHIMVG